MKITKEIEKKIWVYAVQTAKRFYVPSRLWQSDDFEEMVAEALAKMVEAVETFNPAKGSLDTWLIAHARFAVKEWIREYKYGGLRGKRAEKHCCFPISQMVKDDMGEGDLLDCLTSADDSEYSKVEYLADVEWLKKSLTPAERKTLDMLEKNPFLPQKELSELMGVTPAAVSHNVRRIKEKLGVKTDASEAQNNSV